MSPEPSGVCGIFDILIYPILSYACEVRGFP